MSDRIATLLPDNLKSRVSRVYVDSREFNDPETGKLIKYDRLVIEILVKDEPYDIELKVDKKDKAILALADVVDKPSPRDY